MRNNLKTQTKELSVKKTIIYKAKKEIQHDYDSLGFFFIKLCDTPSDFNYFCTV